MLRDDFTCSNCKKKFIIADKKQWVYKLKQNGEFTKWFCSYTCLRDFKRKKNLIEERML